MNKIKSMKKYGVDNISRWADLMMDASDEGMADTFTSLVSNSRDDIQAGRAYDAFLRLNRMEYLLKRYKKIINAGY